MRGLAMCVFARAGESMRAGGLYESARDCEGRRNMAVTLACASSNMRGMSDQNMVSVSPEPVPPPLPEVIPGELPTHAYASFGDRLLAWVIDQFVLAGLQMITLMVVVGVGMAVESAAGDSETVKQTLGLVTLAAVVVTGWLYYAIMESSARWQGTVGK